MAQEISEPLGSRNTRHSGNGMAIDQMTGPPSGWCLRRGQPTLEVRWTPANCALRAASLGCDGPTLRREGASLIRYYDVCCGVASVDDDRPSSSVKVIERPFTPSGQPSDRLWERASSQRPATAVRDPAVSFPPIDFSYPRGRDLRSILVRRIIGNSTSRGKGLRPSYCVGSTFLQWPRSSGG